MSASFDDKKPVYKNPRNIAIAAVTLLTVIAVGYYLWPCKGCADADQKVAKVDVSNVDGNEAPDAAVVDETVKADAARLQKEKEDAARLQKEKEDAARLQKQREEAEKETSNDGRFNFKIL